MPHLMCRTCRVRYRRPADALLDLPLDVPLDDMPCGGCGGPLEAVADLERLVGFRVADGEEQARTRRPGGSGNTAWGTLRVDAASLPVPEPPR